MTDLARPFAALPLVGQPYTILTHWPTVVIRCNCAAATVIALVAPRAPATCPACSRSFAILDDLQVRVGQVAPPVGLVQ